MLALILMGIGLFISAFSIGYLRNLVKDWKRRSDDYQRWYEVTEEKLKDARFEKTLQQTQITELQRQIRALNSNQPDTKTSSAKPSRKKKTKTEETKETTKPHDIDIYEE